MKKKKKSHSDWVKFPAASIIHGEIKDKFTAQRKWIGLPGPETSREICSPRLLSPGNSGTNGINVKTLPWKIQRAPLIEKAIGRRRARVIDAEGKTGVTTFGIFVGSEPGRCAEAISVCPTLPTGINFPKQEIDKYLFSSEQILIQYDLVQNPLRPDGTAK